MSHKHKYPGINCAIAVFTDQHCVFNGARNLNMHPVGPVSLEFVRFLGFAVNMHWKNTVGDFIKEKKKKKKI